MNEILQRSVAAKNELATHPFFYLFCVIFIVFQLVADVCARYAGDSSKFYQLLCTNLTPDITVEVIVRAFFCLIQTVMLLLYEGGVSPVQLRVILLLWANSFVKACSVESNPIETLLVLSVALWSLFDSMDGEMKENTKMRA